MNILDDANNPIDLHAYYSHVENSKYSSLRMQWGIEKVQKILRKRGFALKAQYRDSLKRIDVVLVKTKGNVTKKDGFVAYHYQSATPNIVVVASTMPILKLFTQVIHYLKTGLTLSMSASDELDLDMVATQYKYAPSENYISLFQYTVNHTVYPGFETSRENFNLVYYCAKYLEKTDHYSIFV